MEALSFKTQSFEGPLDLLLYLISKKKLSICDVSLAEISGQFFEYIKQMQEDDIELSSEFLVTASQLLYIKSKELLPKQEEDTKEESQEDLTKRLLEYKKYKEISQIIKENQSNGDKYLDRPPEKIDIPFEALNLQIPISKLISAFYDVVHKSERKKMPKEESFKGIIGREKVSIRKMSKRVLEVLNGRKRVKFIDVFKDMDKPHMVATFLAVLELVKLQRILIFESNGQIFLSKCEKFQKIEEIKFEFE